MKLVSFTFSLFFLMLFSCQSEDENIRAELNKGKKEWFNRDEQKALVHFNKVLEIDSNNADAILAIGDIYFQKNDYDNAIKYYTKAISNDTMLGIAYKKRGGVYNVLNQLDKKCEDYLKADELGVENMTNLISNCR